MIKINSFVLGKKKKYRGFSVVFFNCIKLERITYKDNFMYRLEFYKWR